MKSQSLMLRSEDEEASSVPVLLNDTDCTAFVWPAKDPPTDGQISTGTTALLGVPRGAVGGGEGYL